MTKPFEFHGVEAEKAEAIRRYNNRRNFRNILRAAAVALLCYLWFPTVAISLQTAGEWFHRTGVAIVTNRSVVFLFTNLLVALIFLLSSDGNDESSRSNTEQDLYEQYTSSSSAVIVTAASACDDKVEDDDSNKQMVPAFIPEVEEEVVVEEANRDMVTTNVSRSFRRTRSETDKKNSRPVTEFRRTESAKVEDDDSELSSEEFRLRVERFIKEMKRNLSKENDVVQTQGLALVGAAASGYASC